MIEETPKDETDSEARFVGDGDVVDRIFLDQPSPTPFRFDAAVALAFDDMALRSIPLYAETQRLTSRVVEHFARPGSSIYDLGCSTGTSLLFAASRLADPSVRLVGVDNSEPMLERCRARLGAHGFSDRVELICADLLDFELTNASAVILHFTLQFLPIPRRLELLSKIRRALLPGGILLISEKATHGEQPLDPILTSLYYDFKKRNGYSELEIARKREALENVLMPLTVDATESLLRQAGFSKVTLLSKCFQFCSFIAYT